ncbi:hypothetical protein ACRALDRAFT_2036512 [Sodiomyces alcalophilus JCM 7366]|uniref:uncharacterized protein n=1 Tax=Sodiomyces alcalophilus JCM 7366 TaxID=591952 RepID=UPI0039B3D9CC
MHARTRNTNHDSRATNATYSVPESQPVAQCLLLAEQIMGGSPVAHSLPASNQGFL